MTRDRIRSRVLDSGKPLIVGGAQWVVYHVFTRAGPPRDGEPHVTFALAYDFADACRKAKALYAKAEGV